MKLLSWCQSKAHNQSVLEGSTAPFQALKTPVVLLCVGYPTAAQPTNSESIPSHTHPVRAEQAWVRQSLFPILLMQSLNAVLISGIDRQVCKGNQNRACLCYKTWWPSSQWILPWLQSCFSQDGNTERLNPLTHQHSKSTSLHSKETNIICFHQRECCLLTVHTQCLTSLLLNLHSSKQTVLKMTTTCTLWGLSKAIPSKLLNSFYLPGHYKSFNIYKAFWNSVPDTSPADSLPASWALSQNRLFFPQLSPHYLALQPCPTSTCLFAFRENTGSTECSTFPDPWCHCALDPQQVLNVCEAARRLLGTTPQIITPQ